MYNLPTSWRRILLMSFNFLFLSNTQLFPPPELFDDLRHVIITSIPNQALLRGDKVRCSLSIPIGLLRKLLGHLGALPFSGGYLDHFLERLLGIQKFLASSTPLRNNCLDVLVLLERSQNINRSGSPATIQSVVNR